ncbi:MAG TPA: hypothetical protein VFM45_01205 [Anaeromyxobacteraceae bacterium]|nr:hypothetical protein [Anaeromyxobacteraceae bacterium]
MADKTYWKGGWCLVVRGNTSDAKGRLGAPCPLFVEGQDVKWVAEGNYGASGHFIRAEKASPPPPPLPALGSRVYRVITQSDTWFKGAFSPELLERLLNELGQGGWRAVGMTASDSGTWSGSVAGGPRSELVILLERVVDEAFLLDETKRAGELPSA